MLACSPLVGHKHYVAQAFGQRFGALKPKTPNPEGACVRKKFLGLMGLVGGLWISNVEGLYDLGFWLEVGLIWLDTKLTWDSN